MDDAVRVRLASAAARSGLGQAAIGQAADLSQNRVGIILRGETPPATIGEIYAISAALGINGLRIIQEAEEAVEEEERASFVIIDGDSLPDFSQLAARTVSRRPGWDASQADAGEEPQD